MSKEFSIRVNGVDLRNNTSYQVVPKIDYDAPDGFQEFGTTKIMTSNVSDMVSCVYNSQANVWDTGFYVNSPCYRGWDVDKAKIQVGVLYTHIVQPMEALLGKDVLTHIHTDNGFWDNLMVELRDGKVFNTANPTELLHLYIALLHFNLAPKAMESNIRYKKARYCVVDKAAAVNVKQQREMDKNKAIGLAYALFSSNKNRLAIVLEYLGIKGFDKDTKEMEFNSILNRYIENKTQGKQNVELLLKAVERTESEDGIREFTINSNLKELKRKGIIISKHGELYLDEDPIGGNFRDATDTVLKSKALEEKVFELIMG